MKSYWNLIIVGLALTAQLFLMGVARADLLVGLVVLFGLAFKLFLAGNWFRLWLILAGWWLDIYGSFFGIYLLALWLALEPGLYFFKQWFGETDFFSHWLQAAAIVFIVQLIVLIMYFMTGRLVVGDWLSWGRNLIVSLLLVSVFYPAVVVFHKRLKL